MAFLDREWGNNFHTAVSCSDIHVGLITALQAINICRLIVLMCWF